MIAPRRPILRYHGGKWRLAPWIVGHFPRHKTYVEPFGGAASVLLQKPRSHGEVYNDLDGEIVHVFRTLQDPVAAGELADRLRVTPFARSEWRLAYELTDDPVERARRTIIRSQMGFGSDSSGLRRRTGFRSNANRSGTTPARDWSRWPDEVPRFVERLRNVVIEQKPALEVMADHDGPETLHYVDPPYVHSTRLAYDRVYAHELTDRDHEDLAAFLRGLAGHVVLSGYRSELYDRLYADWPRVDQGVVVFRSAKRVECLWLSPRTLRQGRLF